MAEIYPTLLKICFEESGRGSTRRQNCVGGKTIQRGSVDLIGVVCDLIEQSQLSSMNEKILGIII